MLSRRTFLTGTAAVFVVTPGIAAPTGVDGRISRTMVPFARNPREFKITLDCDAFNVNLRTLHDSLFDQFGSPVAGDSVEVTIERGVTIGTRSRKTPCLDVGAWPAGVAITIDNRGFIDPSVRPSA